MDTSLLIGATVRLRKSEETALNVLLRREGGETHGQPYYKISWAADDNAGLARTHTCGKSDPFDWAGCSCPRHELSIPLCFHENQLSYHLLAFNPPNFQSALMYERQVKEDLSKGSYACLLHFVDPKTGQAFQPTNNVIEVMIPVLRQMNEIARAAEHGYQATVENLRNKRMEQEKREREKKAKEYDTFADAVLEDATPAFGGNPMTGHGPKRASTSDLVLSDIDREK